MTPAEEALIRAAVALQVATLEHALYGVTRQQSIHAMIECKNAISEAIADLKREDRNSTERTKP